MTVKSLFLTAILLFVLASCSTMISDFSNLRKKPQPPVDEPSFTVEFYADGLGSDAVDFTHPILPAESVPGTDTDSYEAPEIDGFEFFEKSIDSEGEALKLVLIYTRKIVPLKFDLGEFYSNQCNARWRSSLDAEDSVYIIERKIGSYTEGLVPGEDDLDYDLLYIFSGWVPEGEDSLADFAADIPTFPAGEMTFTARFGTRSAGGLAVDELPQGDISVSVSVDGTTVTASCSHPEDLIKECSWFLDGVAIDGSLAEIVLSGLSSGTHTLTVCAAGNYADYTKTVLVTVE